MLAIAFRFIGGRCHATPWGRHVNEADVAWPPDPWRITRGLIAVWHRKLDPEQHPADGLRALLAQMATAGPPWYRLPDVAVHSHTRHYMPAAQDKKVLVFDAFARVDMKRPLVVAWPSLQLEADSARLLDVLLANLGYLGRTESWVEALRIDHAGPFDCVPAIHAARPDTGEIDGDIVRLYVPQTPEAYAQLRTDKLQRMVQDGANRHRKAVAATLPADWLDAIAVETGELQAAGWNMPPCARSVDYCRPRDALRSTVQPDPWRTGARTDSPHRPTTARFAIHGKPLPRLTAAVRIGEAARRAAMGVARRLFGDDGLPHEISGHVQPREHRHAHAFWLPEDADGDGAIDHLLVHAPGGFGRDAVRVLESMDRLRQDDDDKPLRLLLEGIDQCEPFARPCAYAGRASIWRSTTPYLHPWHLKTPQLRSEDAADAGVLRQLQREWALRYPTSPRLVSARAHRDAAGRQPIHFVRTRHKQGLVQPDRLGRMLELRFDGPVRGPVALGFGSHFGLGLFVPDRSGAADA